MTHAQRLAAKLAAPAFWEERMTGYNATSSAVEEQLPRLMGLIDAACKGEHYSMQGILASLHVIQQQAKADALLEIAEEDEIAAEDEATEQATLTERVL